MFCAARASIAFARFALGTLRAITLLLLTSLIIYLSEASYSSRGNFLGAFFGVTPVFKRLFLTVTGGTLPPVR